MRMARILFVVENRIQDPIGVMQLSSILKNDGHQIDLAGYKNDNVYEKVDSFKPDIIGYSIITKIEALFELNRNLKKEFKFFSVWGGSYPTFFPEIIEYKGVDAVVKGEAETSIKKVIERMSPGIYDVEPLVEDLDSLPLPDRGLNDLSTLNPKIANFRNVFFNRGCPYGCTFCFEHYKRAIYKNKGKFIRYKSVDKTIEEIKLIEKILPIEYRKFIRVRDSIFSLNKKWTIEFLEKLKEETRTPLELNCRADLIDEEIAQAIGKSNIFAVKMSVETGDDNLNLNVLKKGFDSKVVLKACEILRRYKVDFMLGNMIALPDEKPQKALKTLKINVKCKPRFSSTFIFMPYPRTTLAEYCYKKGLIDTPLPNVPESYHSLSILNFSEEEKRQFQRIHDLFPIIAYFRFLYPMARFLIYLPLDEIYLRINYAFSKVYKKYLLTPRRLSSFFEMTLFFKFIFYSFRNITTLFLKNFFRFIRRSTHGDNLKLSKETIVED